MKSSQVDFRQSIWGIRPDWLATAADLIRSGGLLSVDQKAADMIEATQRNAREPRITGGGSVAVLPLRGMITPSPSLLSIIFGGGGGGLTSFRASLRELVANDEISAILIDCDSPGGLTDLVPETAAELRDLRGKKPIVGLANTMSASAAYWILSQCDELVVTPSGEVGSIGVFAVHDEYSKMDERIGITSTLIKAGKYKAEANPYEPLSDEAKGAIQKTVDDFYGMFVADVAEGRGVGESQVSGGFAEGRMALAADAVSLGMADRIASFEEIVAELIDNAGRPGSKLGATQRIEMHINGKKVSEVSVVDNRAEVETEPDEPEVDPEDDEPEADADGEEPEVDPDDEEPEVDDGEEESDDPADEGEDPFDELDPEEQIAAVRLLNVIGG